MSLRRSLFFLVLIAAATLLLFLFLTRSAETHFRLSNGLEVVVVPVHKAPVVVQMVWYKIGGADEQKGKAGLAHFLEHLMFRGTEAYPEGVFSRTIAELGGNNNAFTTQDFTVYYETSAKEHLPTLMKLEAERMRGLKLSAQIVDTERNVILEERLMRTDNVPYSLLTEKMKQSLFGDYPYAEPVIGWEKDIRNLTLEDVKEFYDSYYTPKNAVLVLAGDIDPREAKSLATEFYGPIQSSAEAHERNFPPFPTENNEPLVINYSDQKVESPEWIRYYLAPSYLNASDKKQVYAIELAAYLLAGHDNAALYRELTLEKKVASYIASGYDPLSRGPSAFSIYAIPAEGVTLEQLEAAIQAAITALFEKGIDAEALKRAKTSLIASETFSKDNVFQLASMYGEVYATGLPKEYIDSWADEIESISAEDVISALKTIVNSRNVTGKLLPAGEGK